MWSGANEGWREGATPHLRMGPPLKRPFVTFEAAKQGRLDQMIFFFGAADNEGAADDRLTTARQPSHNHSTTMYG